MRTTSADRMRNCFGRSRRLRRSWTSRAVPRPYSRLAQPGIPFNRAATARERSVLLEKLLPIEVNDPAPNREGYSVGAVGCAQLAEDILQVHLDGPGGGAKLSANFLIP